MLSNRNMSSKTMFSKNTRLGLPELEVSKRLRNLGSTKTSPGLILTAFQDHLPPHSLRHSCVLVTRILLSTSFVTGPTPV